MTDDEAREERAKYGFRQVQFTTPAVSARQRYNAELEESRRRREQERAERRAASWRGVLF